MDDLPAYVATRICVRFPRTRVTGSYELQCGCMSSGKAVSTSNC